MAHSHSAAVRQAVKPTPRQNVVRDALIGIVASLGVGLIASAFMMVVIVIFSRIV